MKIDLYTKAILTVIAAALVVHVGQNFIGPANAQFGNELSFTTGGALRVAICGGVADRSCAFVYKGSLNVYSD